MDENTTEEIEKNNVLGYKYAKLNYFGRHMLPVRCARPFSDKVDWIAMLPPGEIGYEYALNYETKEILIADADPTTLTPKSDFLICRTVDQHLSMMRMIIGDIPSEMIYEKKTTLHDTYKNPKEPFIVVQNVHWLLASAIFFFPSEKVRKAHLWHLFY